MHKLESDVEPPIDWNTGAPFLEVALDTLPASDRLAILMRFIERSTFGEIGSVLSLSEDAARKLLSAIYRTGQTFGAAHVIDVLLGNATEKVVRHRHEQLSVFGIGSGVGATAWRSLLRQLLVLGHVRHHVCRQLRGQ